MQVALTLGSVPSHPVVTRGSDPRGGFKQQNREDTIVVVAHKPPQRRTQRTRALQIMIALDTRLPQINLLGCPGVLQS